MKSVVRVEVFAGQGGVVKPNKRGVAPVYLKYISGNAIPRFANVQDGTVMANRGFEVGKTYIADITATGELYEGRIPQFTVDLVQELTGSDLINLFSVELSKTVAQPAKVSTPVTTTSPVTEAVQTAAVEAPATAEVQTEG